MPAEPLTPTEAKAMLDRGDAVVFVDARNRMAWANSTEKVPRAVRIPADEVSEHLAELPPAALPITYCT